MLYLNEEQAPPPGPGEVQIDVRAIGLNRAEALFRRGMYLERPSFPARLGYEAAGIVASLGDGVEQFAVGDAVSLIPLPSLTRWGTWGEVVNLPASHLVRHSADLGWERMAATWMATATAYGALIGVAGMKRDDIVLISAASSSVGLTAIQIALAVGACPIALTRTSAKRAALIEAGAAHVIATAEEDLAERVAEISGGEGAAIAFDPVGGPLVEPLAASLRRGGMLIPYGRLDPRPTPFPLLEVISKGLSVRGFVFSDFVADPARRSDLARFALDALAKGVLDPVIDGVYPLEQVGAANERLESGEQFGKIVIKVG